jgi:hypothetical protein
MPSFSKTLEEAIHFALSLANERKHELATLEHLLLALIDEPDAARVMKACGVDLEALRESLTRFVDNELEALVSDVDGSEAAPTTGFQRVIQRAAIHVQSSGPHRGHRRQRAGRDLRRAREPCGVLPAGAGHDPLRRGQLHLPRRRQEPRLRRDAPGARLRRGDGERGARGGASGGRRAARRRTTRSASTASTSTPRRSRATWTR